MSNPSGPDQNATPAAEETEPAHEPQRAGEQASTEEESPHDETPSDETPHEETPSEETPADRDQSAEHTTEVITKLQPEPEFDSAEPTLVLSGSEEDAATERRYSAPSGYDVKSTEIIRTAPDPATEVISKSGVGADTGPPTATRPAGPQAIPPRAPRHRSWGLVLLLILVIAALAAVAVLGTMWLTHKSSSTESPEDQVRDTIQEFDVAIQKGDLAQLRAITCGTLRDSYVNYPDKDWATTYPRLATAKQYPVVASIDQVAVNDQHAEANVTTFVAYQPQVRSTRSFDLQYVDGRWKICQGPVS